MTKQTNPMGISGVYLEADFYSLDDLLEIVQRLQALDARAADMLKEKRKERNDPTV